MTTAGRRLLEPTHDIRLPVAVAKWPFFALSPKQAELTYEGIQRGRRTYIRLRAIDAAVGVATVADIDVLAWATSIYAQICNDERPLPQALELRPSELLRFFGRPSGGRQQSLLTASLDRLANTFVQTNISSDGSLREFSWIETYAKPQSRQGTWQVRFADWLHEAVAHRHILKVGSTLFEHAGLRRRLYLWACAHAGSGTYVRYDLQLAEAHRKSGSHSPTRKFIYELRGAVGLDDLPGFSLSFDNIEGREHLVITRVTDGVVYTAADASGPRSEVLTFPPVPSNAHAEPLPAVLSNFPPDSDEETPSPVTLSVPPVGLDEDTPHQAVDVPSELAVVRPSVNTPLMKDRTRRNIYF